MRKISTVLPTISLMLFAVSFVSASALADTELVGRSPDEGQSLKQPPERVSLSFAGPVEAVFSPLEVYDAQDRRVDLDNARLDPNDPTVLVVDLKNNLPAGSYTVEYRITGADGHTVTGSYEFAVTVQQEEPSTGEAAEDRTETPADEPTTAEPPESSASEERSAQVRTASEGDGLANVVLYVGIGIVGLTLLGMLALRRR